MAEKFYKQLNTIVIIIYIITHLLEFTEMLDIRMHLWKYSLLALVSRTQLVISKIWNRLLACVWFFKLVQFQIHPLLNILTVPNWLNFKLHYFLIGPKVKILNTVTWLVPIYVTLLHCRCSCVPFMRLTHFPSCASVYNRQVTLRNVRWGNKEMVIDWLTK